MVTCRLLGLLLLVVMSRYGDAYKSNASYMEAILMMLERIEYGMLKLAEQNALGCMGLSYTEKLTGLTPDRLKRIFDEDEVHGTKVQGWSPYTHSTNLMNVRRSISHFDEDDDFQPPLRKPKRNRSSNRNQNVNSNANINTNTNVNSNRAKIFDLSDEITAA